ncbi:MAG TPA: MarR family transcriptional regulator [Baekduia sp.]|nr:MarR family transcriptional regulator [Baekduia sp.]
MYETAGEVDTVAVVSSAEPRISYIAGRLDRALSLAVEERVLEHGLTLPQYTALSVLRMRPGLSNAQLARRAFVRPQSMMQVISKLESAGLIDRRPDVNHGRILRTEITPKGRKVLTSCDRSVTEMEETMLAGLSGEQRETLRDALLDCVRRLGAGLDDVP